MTFDEIVAILKDTTRTDYQRAADIHAALTKASQPSAFNLKAQVQRIKRKPRAAEKWAIENGAQKPAPAPATNGADHEAQP
jgi:hypothetical protein